MKYKMKYTSNPPLFEEAKFHQVIKYHGLVLQKDQNPRPSGLLGVLLHQGLSIDDSFSRCGG